LESIGYRAFQAAVSDLAAMGAQPLAALANLSLPAGFSDTELERLARGQAEASKVCGCPLVGGNLSRAGELSLTTTAVGSVKRAITRHGARPGDELWLLGDVGVAALGLHALTTGARATAALRSCIEAWRRPRARIAEGLALVGRARAALDVSDGLSGDASHLAEASGVRLVLDEALLRRALPRVLERAAAQLKLDPLELALRGGEDYALLAAGPANRRPRGAHAIGTLEAGHGVVLETVTGERRPLGGAYDHFTKPVRGSTRSRSPVAASRRRG
jgi:thiamine-monophosphate kinase